MPRVEEEIVIDRPAEDIFAFVTAPENDREWISTVVERRRETEEPIDVGSRIRAVDKFLGRRIESTLEVTEHQPSTRSSVRLEGPVTARGTYALEPSGTGTRFKWILDADPGLGGLYLGRITDPIVTFVFRRRIRADLRRLKAALEDGDGRAPGAPAEG